VASNNTENLDYFDELINEDLTTGQRVDTVKTARPDLNEALDKANSFLSLIGMITMLMSSVSIALASRQLVNSKKEGFALMQVLGCNFRVLRKISMSELVLILLCGVFFGCLIGFLAQLFLGWFLIEYSSINLPGIELPSFWVFFQALIVAVLLVLTFSWPSFHQVFKSNPLSTMRMEKEKNLRRDLFSKENFLAYILLLIGMLCMLYLITKNLEMALLVSLGFITIALIFFVICFVFLKFIALLNFSYFLKNFYELNWIWSNFRRAANRRGLSISAQIIGLGISIAALSTSAFVQKDLVRAWKNLIPDNAPNNFVINIQQDQKNDFKSFLASNNIGNANLYPMVKARLIMINNKKLLLEDFSSLATKRLLKREINLSYGKKIPAHNKIVEGADLNAQELEVSVEQDFAKKFSIRLGDVLSFDIAGEKLDVTVTSIRALKWESMQVNFFMFLSETALIEKPQSAVTAFYFNSLGNSSSSPSPSNSPEKMMNVNFKSELLKKFPNLTVVDTELIAKQVRKVINQSVFAVQFLFLFCLISGCLVLWACLISSRDERIKEVVLLRSFGATARQLALAQWFELLSIGFISGFLATAMAQVLAKIVAVNIFSLDLALSFPPLLIGGLIGASFSLISGTLALKGILSTPTIHAIRQIS
jgi:putative ABC transport system permease protein